MFQIVSAMYSFARSRLRVRWVVVVLVAGLLGSGLSTGCQRRTSPVETGNAAGILHRGNATEVEALDPHIVRGAPEWSVAAALYEGLVVVDPATLLPVPGVAERWEISADGLTYRFFLRPDARWSNGDPVTAADWVFSARRMLAPALASAHVEDSLGFVRGALAHQRGQADFSEVGVRAEGDGVFVMELARPTAFFINLLTQFYPVHPASVQAAGPFDQRSTGWTDVGKLISNGPFQLVRRVQNQEIVVERNPHYWAADEVKLQEVRYYPIENADTEEASFRNDQLHITATLPPAKFEFWQQERPEELRVVNARGTYFYTLNVNRPHLRDRRVRQALSLAVDRVELARFVAKRDQVPAWHLVPPGYADYRSTAQLRSDPEAARALLAEAGFPGGQGFPGVELLVDSREEHRRVAEAIQRMWRSTLGIEVNILSQETRVLIAAKNALEFDVVRGSWNSPTVGPWFFLAPWVSDGLYNEAKWADADYDQIVAAALDELDATRREALWQQAEERLLEELPVIPLYHINDAFLMKPSVRGWHPQSFADRYVRYLFLDAQASR